MRDCGINRAFRRIREHYVVKMKLTTVKLRRFERGLLQMEVAKRAEISCGRLSAIENGSTEPQPDELQRIATVLGIPTQRLLDCGPTSS